MEPQTVTMLVPTVCRALLDSSTGGDHVHGRRRVPGRRSVRLAPALAASSLDLVGDLAPAGAAPSDRSGTAAVVPW
jgi:hypothetical protein